MGGDNLGKKIPSRYTKKSKPNFKRKLAAPVSPASASRNKASTRVSRADKSVANYDNGTLSASGNVSASSSKLPNTSRRKSNAYTYLMLYDTSTWRHAVGDQRYGLLIKKAVLKILASTRNYRRILKLTKEQAEFKMILDVYDNRIKIGLFNKHVDIDSKMLNAIKTMLCDKLPSELEKIKEGKPFFVLENPEAFTSVEDVDLRRLGQDIETATPSTVWSLNDILRYCYCILVITILLLASIITVTYHRLVTPKAKSEPCSIGQEDEDPDPDDLVLEVAQG